MDRVDKVGELEFPIRIFSGATSSDVGPLEDVDRSDLLGTLSGSSASRPSNSIDGQPHLLCHQ